MVIMVIETRTATLVITLKQILYFTVEEMEV